MTPSETRTYTLTAVGKGGTATKSTTVTVEKSSPPPTPQLREPDVVGVVVPRVKGLSQVDAVEAIRSSGLAANSPRYVNDPSQPDSTVLYSEPAEDSRLASNSAVTLFINRKPAPRPSALPPTTSQSAAHVTIDWFLGAWKASRGDNCESLLSIYPGEDKIHIILKGSGPMPRCYWEGYAGVGRGLSLTDLGILQSKDGNVRFEREMESICTTKVHSSECLSYKWGGENVGVFVRNTPRPVIVTTVDSFTGNWLAKGDNVNPCLWRVAKITKVDNARRPAKVELIDTDCPPGNTILGWMKTRDIDSVPVDKIGWWLAIGIKNKADNRDFLEFQLERVGEDLHLSMTRALDGSSASGYYVRSPR